MMNDPRLLEDFAHRFRFYAEKIYGRVTGANSSPFYAYLAAHVADDPDILALLVNADQPATVPELLFGAVHYLLLGGAEHRLRNYYPSLVRAPFNMTDSYPHFREFCLHYSDIIRHLVTIYHAYPSDVQQCTSLVPVLGLVADRTGNMPLAMLEIGAGAGLTLLWDKYGYHYGGAGTLNPKSGLMLNCEVRGEHEPALPVVLPNVGFRLGIDLAPVNIHDNDSVRWLRALIWPERHERAEIFEQVIPLARRYEIPLVQGDAAVILPTVLKGIPRHMPLVIVHTFNLDDLPPTMRDAILRSIDEHSRQRDIWRIAIIENPATVEAQLKLFSYRNGSSTSELLAYVDGRGRWIEWQPRWF